MTIPVHLLRPADIIVSSTGAKTSGTIRAGTGSSVSHAMVYIGNQFVVEAIPVGIVKHPLREALRYATLAIALRRRNLTNSQAKAVVKHAEDFSKQRLPYDYTGAAGSGLGTRRGQLLTVAVCGINPMTCMAGRAAVKHNASPKNADKAFFCSELVARVFELAGAPIVKRSPSFTTPRHVRVASSLLYVAHLKDT